ncbi:MAG: hypothetical protein ACI87E_004717, partial [Mariniblastus sp.]
SRVFPRVLRRFYFSSLLSGDEGKPVWHLLDDIKRYNKNAEEQ